MAAVIKGEAHLYGIQGGVAVVEDATVISFSLTREHKNTAQTLDEIGNEIERRYDDLHKDGTLVIRPRSGFTDLDPATTYAYDGVTFEIISEGREEQQKDFVTLSYTIKASEYIAYA
jgi:hypothetical protein